MTGFQIPSARRARYAKRKLVRRQVFPHTASTTKSNLFVSRRLKKTSGDQENQWLTDRCVREVRFFVTIIRARRRASRRRQRKMLPTLPPPSLHCRRDY